MLQDRQNKSGAANTSQPTVRPSVKWRFHPEVQRSNYPRHYRQWTRGTLPEDGPRGSTHKLGTTGHMYLWPWGISAQTDTEPRAGVLGVQGVMEKNDENLTDLVHFSEIN